MKTLKRPKTQPITAFRWVGSKWKLMPSLLPLIPNHVRYVSVFGGSAADILRKPRSKEEVFNDLDCDVATFYQVLQDTTKRKRLCTRLLLTPYGRSQFVRCVELLQSHESDPIKRAWAFAICTTLGYCSKAPDLATPGSFVVCPKILRSRRWTQIAASLDTVARRFRQVLVENRTWEQVIEQHDRPDTFFYCDPPYMWGTRVSNAMYRHEMADDAHEQLVARLKQCKGLVMLSGYATQCYDDALGNWRRAEFNTLCSVSANKKKPRRTEIVWMNYDTHGRQLDS